MLSILYLIGEGLVLLASWVAALAVLEKFVKTHRAPKCLRRMFSDVPEQEVKELKAAIHTVDARVTDIEMWNLRKLIDDERVDLEGRVLASQEYIDKGYNSVYQAKAEILTERYKEELEPKFQPC